MKAAWILQVCFIAAAQTPAGTDQTGSVAGVVTDALTHLPVKKTVVSLLPNGNFAKPQGQMSATTDASGAYTLTNLQAGRYRLLFQQQSYPQARFGGMYKPVEIKAGAAATMNVELIPGAAVTGHIVDEDGEPMSNCYVQIHPAKNPEQGVPMMGGSGSNQEGEYRLFGVAAGKYILSAQCGHAVFQARPFSAGPDPLPSRAYPMQYYPLTTEAKSAQAVELTAGNEKSGVDFLMAPSAVTQVRGAFSPGGADWHTGGFNVQMVPFDEHRMNGGMNVGASLNLQKGTFEFRQVFPGSYLLFVISQGGENQVGAWQRVEVSDKPVELSLELKRSIELSGKIEIESSANTTTKTTPGQVNIQLIPQFQFGMPGSGTQVNDDGTFTLKGVMPAMFRVQASAPAVFLKAAWLGSTDVTNTLLDVSSGAAGALRIVLSTNMASISGSAPPGEQVFATREELSPSHGGWNTATQADQNGQYKFAALPPGKYRLVLMGGGGPMPDEGGQEVTVREGETATVDLKPSPQ